ncbi:unnamed protein product [Meloidogyne enterolobii]|uniref:Uncharacterized protein n=1 Tax=Meloidogyne enterolobii TaxID=390850 RepID=A0ACB1B4P0_MELEN
MGLSTMACPTSKIRTCDLLLVIARCFRLHLHMLYQSCASWRLRHGVHFWQIFGVLSLA